MKISIYIWGYNTNFILFYKHLGFTVYADKISGPLTKLTQLMTPGIEPLSSLFSLQYHC